MGHRANFVIIRNNTTKLYGESWAAVDSIYYFAAGPTSALENAVSKWENEAFYDWAFAEGGYLLDFDKQLAIGFGASIPDEEIRIADRKIHPDIALVNAALMKSEEHFLGYISKFWPSWTLVWDDRGVDAFSEYLVKNGIDTLAPLKPSHPRNIKPPVRLDPK